MVKESQVTVNTHILNPNMVRNVFKELIKRIKYIKKFEFKMPIVEIREGRTRKGVADYLYPDNIIIIDTNWAKFYSRVYQKSPQFVKKELTLVLGHELAHMIVQTKYPYLNSYQDEVTAYKVMKIMRIPIREPATYSDRMALDEAEKWWQQRQRR